MVRKLESADKETKENTNKNLFHTYAREQWGIKMSIPTKAINKYTDCNHKIIFNGIFHRNRNIPNIRLLILNRTLNGQEDSDKEEHNWRYLPLWLQTTSRSCSNYHSEELAGTQTHGIQERIESPGMNPHVPGQFMKIKPGTSEEERTVFLRNTDRKTGHLLGRTSVKVIL